MFVLQAKNWCFVSACTGMIPSGEGFIGLLVVLSVFLGASVRGTSVEELWLGLSMMALLII